MRRLPVLAERAVSHVKALQISAAAQFMMPMHQDKVVVACKRGCNWCCYHPFAISIAEGVLLYRYLAENGKWTSALRRVLDEARQRVVGLDPDIWLLSNVPCPLLDSSGDCSAYEARPLRCRVMFSLGDPDQCRPNQFGPRTPVVHSLGAVAEFNAQSRTVLKQAGSTASHLMPLVEAVLLGEAVDTQKLPIKDVDKQYIRNLISG